MYLKQLPRVIQMMKLNRILIKTFVIFLTQLLPIEADCFWDSTSQTDCAISCTSSYTWSGSETSEQVLANLEEKWIQVLQKRRMGKVIHTR